MKNTQGNLKTQKEIELIAENGKLIRDILLRTANLAKPGVSTSLLNDYTEAEIKRAGGRPSFLGYGAKNNPFPAGLCTSINNVVVHGIPSETDILKEGDILGLDIGMEYKGLYTDTAITVPVGRVSAIAMELITTTRKCLHEAIKQALPGKKTGDIGNIIQSIAENAGFSVVRDLVGHGVGYAVHEDPAIPCYGKAGTGVRLETGMVIAIEPMLCAGDYQVYFDDDGWTIKTRDKSLSAHFEHTVAITEKGPRVLT